MYTYLLINILVIIVPLVFSFDRKVNFYKSWPALFPAMALTGALFIAWDAIFTHFGVWGFNDAYLIGVQLAGLPLEEWLFFITVPYASVFSYRVLNEYLPLKPHPVMQRFISYGLLLMMIGAALVFYDRIYTVLTFSLTATFVLIAEWFLKSSNLIKIYRVYLIILVPFLIVNGILTGTGLDEPVVWYNNAENMTFRLFTIPPEDIFYGFLLIGLNIILMERFQKKMS